MTRKEQKRKIRSRAIQEAEYIINTYASTTETAMEFNVSQSTVCRDMKRLKDINYDLYISVQKIFNGRRKYQSSKKKTQFNYGVYIIGTKKGEIKKTSYFIRVNEDVPYVITKYGRYWKVCAPVNTAGKCSKKEIYNLFMYKINEMEAIPKVR